ncbi:MAG TPA: minor capsid protein [Candidatus Eisenbergiella merdipullorum]|uniref:Minor capsid protein n=1 Tax=Candidatus Eisenbergiella merdipullorum TaxID=2838553 RepID=A0A9D2KYU7_9FIRM|nr:minor capsid protein [Candidatus Eisenbergiella merdipullorum]
MKLHSYVGGVEINIDTSRIDDNLREAQKALNLQVVADSKPFVPYSQGALRSKVEYPEGLYGGEIMYNTPYAHYLYEGTVYGPNIPIKDAEGNITGWRSPPKKYPTQRKLQYHTAGTGPQWFEEAKRRHKQDWIKIVKETAGKK